MSGWLLFWDRLDPVLPLAFLALALTPIIALGFFSGFFSGRAVGKSEAPKEIVRDLEKLRHERDRLKLDNDSLRSENQELRAFVAKVRGGAENISEKIRLATNSLVDSAQKESRKLLEMTGYKE
jgi:hypothetical protein